jgi:hypothetical protein
MKYEIQLNSNQFNSIQINQPKKSNVNINLNVNVVVTVT